MRFAATYLLVFLFGAIASASENTLLVINQESASSKLVGNFYSFERNIPASNVVYVSGIPQKEVMPIDKFRELILKPIFAKIEARGLANQIDCIVYSTDFPTIIDATPDRQSALKEKNSSRGSSGKVFTPLISINAATYFYQSVLASELQYLSLGANTYARDQTKTLLTNPFESKEKKKFREATRSAQTGNFDLAIENLDKLIKKHPLQLASLYWMARCHAWKGNGNEACQWLKKCIAVGWSCREYTRSDPAFEKIKSDEDFRATIKLIPNLPFRGGPSIGFRSGYIWGPNGMINSTIDQGNRYMLSTVLGVNRNKGNSEREILYYLKRSIKADGTMPKGTFYFTKTKDVRTKTRIAGISEACDELNALGYPTEVVTSVLPKFKRDVAGLSIGSSKFNLETAGLSFLPGAICENLTSFGGRLLPNTSQTKLTSFLRFGSAGSSGTIVEPFAIQAKFPHPRIHVHYVRGCTLAESFYQSVEGPFQLLIVGDAMCRPWAKIPRLKLSGPILNDEPIADQFTVRVTDDNSPTAIRLVEMYLDDHLIRRMEASKLGQITIDSKTMPDGYHELRFVAVSATAVSTRGSVSAGFVVNNTQKSVQLTANNLVSDINESIEFNVVSSDADKTLLLHNKRIIKSVDGETLSVSVPAFYFGRGTVQVEAVALYGNQYVRSRPTQLQIQGPISSTVPQIKNVK